jgi:TolB protein
MTEPAASRPERRQRVSDWAPAWSPDGRTIAFVSNRDGAMQLYAVSPDGSNLRRLTHGEADEWAPAWSPDGGRLAFWSEREGGQAEVFVMDADGSNVRRITSGARGDWGLAWSSDGRAIAYTLLQGGRRQLCIVDVESGAIRELATEG